MLEAFLFILQLLVCGLNHTRPAMPATSAGSRIVPLFLLADETQLLVPAVFNLPRSSRTSCSM
jgi:hypothetical protein